MHVIKKNKHPSDFSTIAFNFGYYSLLLRSKKTVLTNIWRILSSVSYTYALVSIIFLQKEVIIFNSEI